METKEIDIDELSDIFSESNEMSLTCHKNCKHERSERPKPNVKMIQCCLCATWFHYECVGLKKNDIVGVWPCPSCRLMPQQIRILQKDMATLQSDNGALLQEIRRITALLEKINSEATEHLLRDQNRKLEAMDQQQTKAALILENISGNVKKITTSMDIEDYDVDVSFSDEEADEPCKILMVGDSMLRDVTSTSEQFTCVSIAGAKLYDIRKHLRSLNPRKERFKKIFIVCGTNDCTTKKTSESIVNEFSQTITMAKEKAKEVFVSSVLPRLDEKVETGKINKVNQLLKGQSNSLKAVFINNDRNFKFQDGSVDETLLLTVDKLHLSPKGSNRLIQNLELVDMAKMSAKTPNGGTHRPPTSNSVQSTWKIPLPTPEAPEPPPVDQKESPESDVIKFRGGNSSFSNFYMTSVHAWNVNFKSVEHGYVYYKVLAMGQPQLADKILAAHTAKKAKDIGDSIVTNNEWHNLKTGVMYYLLQQKARQCKQFSSDLKNSQRKLIVEDTNHEFWGRGRNGNGSNFLGRLLMTLRNNLPPSEEQCPLLDVPSHPPPPPLPSTRLTNFAFTPRPKAHPYRQRQGRNYPGHRDEQQHCFNCGEKSHNVQSCHHPTPLQCYSCSGKGHKRKFCPFGEYDLDRGLDAY